MKVGTVSKVMLGGNADVAEKTGIIVDADVILGKAEGRTKDLKGLVLSNKLMFGKSVSRAKMVTVSGVAPLVLADAISAAVVELIAFGGTEQRNLPDGYTQLAYLESDGKSYINTGIKSANTVKAEFMVDRPISPASGSVWVPMGTILDSNGQFSIFESTNAGGDKYVALTYGVASGSEVDASGGTTAVSQSKFVLDDGVLTFDNGAKTVTSPQAGTTFSTQNDIWLFLRPNTSSGTAVKMYYCKLWNNGTLVRNLVPCKNASNVIGMYDLVSGQFFTNAGTGTFTAGADAVPTPDYPMDIVCNNGVLKARHQSGLPLGYTLLDYIESTGTQYIDTGIVDITDSEFVLDARLTATSASGFPTMLGALSTTPENKYKVVFGETSGTQFYTQPGTGANSYTYASAADTNRHVFKLTTGATSGGTLFIDNDSFSFSYEIQADTTLSLYLSARNKDNDASNFITMACYRLQAKKSGVLVRDFVPCKNASNVVGMYDLVSGQFFTNAGTGDFTAGNAVSDPVEVYTTGPIETIAIKDDQSATVSTATCENLLSISTYTDEQEVISGAVTRKVGILVFDGTENWNPSSSVNGMFYLSDSGATFALPNTCICSHFSGCESTVTSANMPDMSARCGFVGYTHSVYMKNIAFGLNLATWKQFLADQYAAGTPVMIIYPLATPTTESVTGQPMATTQGDNVAEITQASLGGLELSVTYMAGVNVTVEEIEDAQLSPDVEVTIQ